MSECESPVDYHSKFLKLEIIHALLVLPLCLPPTMSSGTMNGAALLALRREMQTMHGWKKDYGMTTSCAEASRKRAAAEAEANAFVIKAGDAFGLKAQAERFVAVWEKLKVDFGWKADYGLTTSTAKASEKRAEAERKADEAVAAMLTF